MIALQEALHIETRGAGFTDVTSEVARVVTSSKARLGTCTVFVRHTSASLLIQENADPAVLRDLERWMTRLAPHGPDYEHDAEGPDDMPAHLRAAITRTSEAIPVTDGRLGLGTWQALYLWEHRARAHTRELVVTVLGV